MRVIGLVSALIATALSVTEASTGVCYSPWHHGQVNADIIKKDMQQVKQHFGGIRTFHADFAGVNAIDAAASAGLKIAVGIQMQERSKIDAEIKAAVEGAKRNPQAVEAIYVGNENLQNAGHGTFSAGELVGYINSVKAQLKGSPAENIKVGSVQRITEWKECAAAKELAAASDVIGVNIYPFFTNGKETPIQKFSLQYNSLLSDYPVEKIRVTESGWPRAGSPFESNIPSQENAQQFFDRFVDWSAKQPMSFYFMMYDLKDAPAGKDFEKFFGLADEFGNLKINVPSGLNAGAAPAAPNVPHVPNVPKVTPAASVQAPPAPTPAASAPKPVSKELGSEGDLVKRVTPVPSVPNKKHELCA